MFSTKSKFQLKSKLSLTVMQNIVNNFKTYSGKIQIGNRRIKLSQFFIILNNHSALVLFQLLLTLQLTYLLC